MHSSRIGTARSSSRSSSSSSSPPDQAPPGSRHPPWTEFLTHASENITLPQTSFAGGNNGTLCLTLSPCSVYSTYRNISKTYRFPFIVPVPVPCSVYEPLLLCTVSKLGAIYPKSISLRALKACNDMN